MPRWLVINKTDLVTSDVLAERHSKLLADLGWQGRVFEVSAATGAGTDELGQAVMRKLELIKEEADALLET